MRLMLVVGPVVFFMIGLAGFATQGLPGIPQSRQLVILTVKYQ
jgi:hypothetical protein